MNLENIQDHCRTLPGTTEDMKWGNHLVFSVAEKMYAIIGIDHQPSPRLTLKSTPEAMALLTQKEHVIPAPYMARYHWVTLEHLDVFDDRETLRLIHESYELVFAKLRKKRQRELRSNQNT